MRIIESVRRNERGHVQAVIWFRLGSDGTRGTSLEASVDEVIRAWRAGERINVQGRDHGPGGGIRVAQSEGELETLVDVPETREGRRLVDLPTF